jgi:CheY-like chemotaxis protein
MIDRPKVIYVDDEEINLMLFREMFKNDFQIHTTTSPPDAIAYLKANRVDFILTDQLMPEMTGVEFLKELDADKTASSSKRVMISGYTQEGDIKEALENHLIDRFVPKPFTYNGLKEIIQAIT